MTHFFQKFDGKEYQIGWSYNTKAEAKIQAESMRDLYYVRTIKSGKK